MQALKSGVALDTVRRPIEYTKVKLAGPHVKTEDDMKSLYLKTLQ